MGETKSAAMFCVEFGLSDEGVDGIRVLSYMVGTHGGSLHRFDPVLTRYVVNQDGTQSIFFSVNEYCEEEGEDGEVASLLGLSPEIFQLVQGSLNNLREAYHLEIRERALRLELGRKD